MVYVIRGLINIKKCFPSKNTKYHASDDCSILKRDKDIETKLDIYEAEELKSLGFSECKSCFKLEKVKRTAVTTYPIRKQIVIYETSDGSEFGNEIDALRRELELCSNRRRVK